MKVITNSYGVCFNPRWQKSLQKVINKMSEKDVENQLWRLDEKLVKLIEKKLSEIEWLSKHAENNPKLINKLKKLTNHSKNESWMYFKITEVDTSRKWLFTEYDSLVDVTYLEEVDSNLNFYKASY